MLRFVLRKKFRDCHCGMEGEHLITLDVAVPELEAALSAGGYSETGYDLTELVGVEVLPALPSNAGIHRAAEGRPVE